MQEVLVEEASWWAAACAGEGRAFTRLFALHRDGVFRYALRLVPSAADADDVALRRLRPVDLSLLTLTVFEGYSVSEAAAVLHLSDSTARSRLSRARTRLRTELRIDPTAPSTVLEES